MRWYHGSLVENIWRCCSGPFHADERATQDFSARTRHVSWRRAFRSTPLHSITGLAYRETARNPCYNLLLAIRKRKMRFLGHVLRMDAGRLVRRTLAAYVNGGSDVPEGSLLQDCEDKNLDELTRLATNRCQWSDKVTHLH